MALEAPADLNFPVLQLSQDTSVSVARSADELCSCNAYAFWHNDYFRDMHVVDADAAPFAVAEAKTERAFSPLRRFLARLLNQRLRVEVDLRPAGPPSLESAKELVSEWLDRDPERWESGRPLSAWKRQIAACKDMRALITLLE